MIRRNFEVISIMFLISKFIAKTEDPFFRRFITEISGDRHQTNSSKPPNQ